MPIVIDANTIPSVLDKQCQNHSDFQCVLSWIISGKGKMVFGGKKYLTELRLMTKYAKIVEELRKSGKVVRICDAIVDAECKKVESICSDDSFNDPHLVAIVRASGCRLICSKDLASFCYLKRPDLYKEVCSPPKIFSGNHNSDLLNDRRNIPLRLKNIM